ncbi:MAG: signal peptide peptidase SppA [Lachnospiraceae bacterium]|nr:signal peptide peptidase SppA [Lachnospiraceae bacterium]
MSKKQTTWLIVAAVVFVVTGVISVISNAIADSMFTGKEEKAASGFESIMNSIYGGNSFSVLDDMPVTENFIAVVPVQGTIQASESSSGLYGTSVGYNHDLLIEYVNRLMNNSHNKGIILRLDTPGGTVYEADEFYLKLKEYKEKTGRPIWAYMESTCCSGGVYIASSADEQYANRITTTGSIGVIVTTYDMSGLYEKLGIKEVNIVSAKNKDMGTAAKPMTKEQLDIYQSIVDEYYEQFVGIVADGRGMSVDEVKKLADGRVYTAKQAEENGLIDGIKGSEEFDAYVREQSGVQKFYQPKSSGGYLAELMGVTSASKQKSESEVLVDLMNQLGSGVPMYYAKPIGE